MVFCTFFSNVRKIQRNLVVSIAPTQNSKCFYEKKDTKGCDISYSRNSVFRLRSQRTNSFIGRPESTTGQRLATCQGLHDGLPEHYAGKQLFFSCGGQHPQLRTANVASFARQLFPDDERYRP